MALIGQEENIDEMYAEDILIDSAHEYYLDILCHRAIPDIRDGQTEIQRRILYTCFDKKWMVGKPHVKSARVIGEVTGRFHPHSDDAAYETSGFMSQSWKNQITTIDWHGANGSISGADLAAKRYTEQRLSKEGEILLIDELKNKCVNMKLNYNEDEDEPVYLPSKVPMILINGSFGLASGYMSSIPTHNPREVLQELIKKLKDSEYKINILPDFPTGAILCNTEQVSTVYNNFQEAIKKKYSKAILRAKIKINEKENTLSITEIPFMKSADTIVSSIKKCIEPPKNKKGRSKAVKDDAPKITDISNIKNLTEGTTVHIKIFCKKGADLESVKNQLYRFTLCQVSFPLIFNLCYGEEFIEDLEDINELVDIFLDFRKDTIKRTKTNIIRNKQFRIHVIEGLLIIIKDNDINEVIKKIRKCKNKQEVISMLSTNYGLDEIQATKVAEHKLYQLANFAINDLVEEKDTLEKEVEDELEYFKDVNKLNIYMIEEYENLLKTMFTEKKYPRRTSLENINTSNSEEVILQSIPDEDYVVICTKKGYVKKLEMIKSQKRNTKGVSVGKLKDDDYVIKSTILNSRDNIYIFTESGKVYKMKVYEIPISTTSKLGYNISHIVNDETIVNIIPIKDSELESEDFGIVSATMLNKIKITNLNEYCNVSSSGIISMKVKDGDKIIGVEKINFKEDDSIIALNSSGNAIRVLFEKIPNIKRTTEGSNLFSSGIIKKGITVKSLAVVNNDSEYYMYISNKGLGKLMEKSEFEPQFRGTIGKMAAKVKANDNAEKLIPVNIEDNIVIVSNKNIVKVKAEELSVVKRPTFGNKVKKCSEKEFVIDVAIEKN